MERKPRIDSQGQEYCKLAGLKCSCLSGGAVAKCSRGVDMGRVSAMSRAIKTPATCKEG